MLRAVASQTSGVTQLKTLGASVSAINNTETVVMQALLAPGQWQTNGYLRIELTGGKSGTTDTFRLNVRIGTAGTTGDTAITGLSDLTIINAAGQYGGWVFDIKLNSATSAQKMGVTTAVTTTYSSASLAAANVAATTISSAATNALYVTVTANSSSTTDTVSVTSGRILLIAP
jgi:hypothetical protein